MNIRRWEEGPSNRIDNRLKEAEANKQKAVNGRIRELEKELGEDRRPSKDMSDLRVELEDFRVKMKGLYMSIFQGSKQLSIRKSDFIRQIKGNEGEEYQLY